MILTGFILIYLSIHTALRFTSTTIGVDDVEQMIFAQAWQLGYNPRQPPLYTWLLAAVQMLLGPGLPSLLLVRYSCLGLAFAFCYLMARRMGFDYRLAGLCCLSLTLLYQIGWKMHVGVTHTILLTAALFATLWLLLSLIQQPSLQRYCALGAVVGIGLLSKYSYIIGLLLLLLAMLQQPAGRAILLRPAFLIVPGMAGIILMPYALWLYQGAHDLIGISIETVGHDQPWIQIIVPAFLRLLGAVAGFIAPLAFLMLLFFPKSFDLRTQRTCEANFDVERWLRQALLLALAVLLIAALTGMAGMFKERWMHPFLLPIVPWLFIRVARVDAASGMLEIGSEEKNWGWFLRLSIVLLLAVILFRLGQDLYGGKLCGRCRLWVPFAALVEKVEAAGFNGGTILAGDEHIAGNLRAAFPKTRVLSLRYPYFVPPDLPSAPDLPFAKGGQCLTIWQAEAEQRDRDSAPAPASLLALGEDDKAAHDFSDLMGQNLRLGVHPVTGQAYMWFFHLDPAGRGRCR